MNTRNDTRVAFGLYPEQPSATADGVSAGDIFITTDAGLAERIFIVRLDSTGAREWSEIKALDAPTTLTLYIATTGNNANDGLTPATALLTLDMALRLITENSPTQRWMISMGIGTFPVSPTTVNAFQSNYYEIPYTGGGQGLLVECPAIVGTMVDSGQGVRTMSAFAAGTAPTYTTMTDSVGGFVVSAFSSMWARFVTGANTGKCFKIQDNGAAIITLILNGATGFVNGDTFVIEDIGTIIQKTIPGGSPAQTDTWAGGHCIFDAIVFEYVQNAVTQTVNINLPGGGMGRVRFKNNATATGSLLLNFNEGNWGVGIINRYHSSTVYGPKQNVIGGVDFIGNSSLIFPSFNDKAPSLISGRFENCTFILNGDAQVTGFYLKTGSVSTSFAGSRAFVTNGRIDASPGALLVINGISFRGQILCTNGAYIRVTAVDLSNGTAGDIIVAAEQAGVRASGIVSGGTNTGVPWVCRLGSKIIMDSPGTNQSVLGAVAGTDVTVGGNATTTYANINGRTTAFCTDVGAALSELCLVQR
jgi:hypothetical protein